jgi:Spy/CpxP family protein refolding chaperone
MNIASRWSVLVVALVMLLISTVAEAQRPGGGRGRGGFGGPGGPGGPFGGGIVGLIQTGEVQREIELSADQENELRTLRDTVQEEIRSEMGEMFRNMRDLSDDERRARFDEVRTRMEELNKSVEDRLQKVLLPHQFDRLKQIDVQARVQRGGAAVLTDGELAETLGLTEAQREQIRERAEQVQQDLDAKIRQLRLDARNQLLDVLTTEQRAKLESMMGAEFDVPEPQFGPPGRGGRFAGRGGGERRGRNRGGNQDSPPAAE